MAKDYDLNPRFANWNNGYVDLFEEIREIRGLLNKSMFDFNNKNLFVHQLYSKIRGLFTTHKHYIIDSDRLSVSLNSIENILFTTTYFKNQNKTLDINKQIQIIQILRSNFELMCESFSLNGLTPKVEKTYKPDYKKAVGGIM